MVMMVMMTMMVKVAKLMKMEIHLVMSMMRHLVKEYMEYSYLECYLMIKRQQIGIMVLLLIEVKMERYKLMVALSRNVKDLLMADLVKELMDYSYFDGAWMMMWLFLMLMKID